MHICRPYKRENWSKQAPKPLTLKALSLRTKPWASNKSQLSRYSVQPSIAHIGTCLDRPEDVFQRQLVVVPEQDTEEDTDCDAATGLHATDDDHDDDAGDGDDGDI